MLIIPAIDLQAGRCVRLKQGRFDEVTEYVMDPVLRAAEFAQLKAKRLHVVDLDGAKQGSMQQLPLIQQMAQTGIEIQAGGGIRSVLQAEQCIAAGIERLVLGSIAINDFQLCKQIIETIGPERIVLAVDVRIDDQTPRPATHGWLNNSDTSLWAVLETYQSLGIKEILCTDIACDGMMGGPSFWLYEEALRRYPDFSWQASGGIRDEQDLARLNDLGVAGAILGRCLYQQTFNFASTLRNMPDVK